MSGRGGSGGGRGRGLPPSDRGGGGPRGGGQRGGRGGPVEVEVFSHNPADTLARDMQLLKIENEIEKSYILSSSEETRMPLRPGFGKQGREILLYANYFRMEADVQLLLYRYSIDILPGSDGNKPVGKKAKRIIQLLIAEQFDTYVNRIATDYKSTIVCKSELPIENTSYTVAYKAEGEDIPSSRAKTYRLRLQNSGTMRVSELVDYLTSTRASAMFGSKNEVIQALNIVLGQYPKASDSIFSVGANKHWEKSPATNDTRNLGAGLQAIRGFFVSIRAATSILVNVNIKHVVCYDSGPLGQVIFAFLQENGGNYIKLASFLKRVRIHVTHIIRKSKDGNVIPRLKTISGLATPRDGSSQDHPPKVSEFAAGPKNVKFHLGKPDPQSEAGPSTPSGGKKSSKKKAVKAGPNVEEYISVHDFFRNTYDIKTDPSLPVVNVGTQQAPTYLPAEVCEVLHGQPCGTKLSPKQTQNMIRFAVREPAKNAKSIVINGSKILGIEPPKNQVLKEFGIEITPRLITVPGRVLKAPDVKYHMNKTASTRFGSWNMLQIKFTESATLDNWTYLWITDGRRDAWNNDEKSFDASMNVLKNKLKAVGLNCSDFNRGQHISVTSNDAEQKVTGAFRNFAFTPNKPKPKLVIVAMPAIDKVIYNSVKSICDTKAGIHSVCVLSPNFAKIQNDQYFSNVSLKVNLKLGGRNQTLEPLKLGIISEGKTMVVGIDVTHPAPGSSSSAPSVAGIVASTDKWLSQWPADLRIQPKAHNKEMVAALDEMMKSRLLLWRIRNKVLPENLLIYRDGVSEGEYQKVVDEELPLIQKACKGIYPASDTQRGLPRITIIVVGKRHNTRFYPTRKEDADRSSNPQHGTVVDRDVTETRNWDFFLQAHTALQGTARPAHYYIVWDQIFQKRPVPPHFKNVADVVEDLTHNMCYLFGRATKAVSICPAAYYADLVCERARCYLSRLYDASSVGSVSDGSDGGKDATDAEITIHGDLKNTMFYI